MDYDDDEPTGRIIAQLRPAADEVRDAIAHLRFAAHRDRRERRSFKRWILGASVSVAMTVVVSGGTVAIRVGQLLEQLATASRDTAAVTQRLERLEQHLIDGDGR